MEFRHSPNLESHLPPPARFFPLSHGRYEVVAGLRPLGTDFGNGADDGSVFILDRNFAHYRAAKLRARSERLEMYYPDHARINPGLLRAAVGFCVEALVRKYTGGFEPHLESDIYVLRSHFSGDVLRFSKTWELIGQETSATPPYRDALDAVASQVQEDVALWQRAEDGSEWLAAIHLCFPNHWAAEDKIGRPFNAVHAPVAGFERLAKAAPSLVDGMITKGPFVRFAWGVATDAELNHHPAGAFQGRQFDPAAPRLFVRVERQTLTPFPAANGALFTIRTYFLDCASELSASERAALGAAIESMTPESLAYKGLAASRDAILKWLKAL